MHLYLHLKPTPAPTPTTFAATSTNITTSNTTTITTTTTTITTTTSVCDYCRSLPTQARGPLSSRGGDPQGDAVLLIRDPQKNSTYFLASSSMEIRGLAFDLSCDVVFHVLVLVAFFGQTRVNNHQAKRCG